MKNPIKILYLYLGADMLLWIIVTVILFTVPFQDAGALIVILPAIALSVIILAVGLMHYAKAKSSPSLSPSPENQNSSKMIHWVGIGLLAYVAYYILAPIVANLFSN
jgi:hypothetical protein